MEQFPTNNPENTNQNQEANSNPTAEILSNMPSFEEHMESMKNSNINKYGQFIDDDIDSSIYNIHGLEVSREKGINVIDVNSNKMTGLFEKADGQFRDTTKYIIEERQSPTEKEKNFYLVSNNGKTIVEVDINRFNRNDDGTYSRKSLVKIAPIEKNSKGAYSIDLFNKNIRSSQTYSGDIYGIAEINEDGSFGKREIIDKGAIEQYEKTS